MSLVESLLKLRVLLLMAIVFAVMGYSVWYIVDKSHDPESNPLLRHRDSIYGWLIVTTTTTLLMGLGFFAYKQMSSI